MFRNRLRHLREDQEITQQGLGNFLGVSKQTISNYENGVSAPDQETLGRLADYFRVSVDYLLGRTDDPHPHTLRVADNLEVTDNHVFDDGRKGAPPVPSWLSSLPPDMQDFVAEESKYGWPYMRLARGLKMQDLTREELMVILETWMDAKQRHEKESE